MTVALLLLTGAFVGFAVARWWVVALGPAAGALVVLGSVYTGASGGDTPAIFVAGLVAAALAAGVMARLRLRSAT